MARQFATAILLPGAPANTNEAATKGYVDTGLAGKAATPILGTALPLVLGNAPSATTVTTTVTPDASTGPIFNWSCTTATLAVGVPTSPADREVLRIAVIRSTAASVVVTFNGSIALSTGLTSSAYTVPSGKVLLAAVEYSAMLGAWVLTAATVSA